MTGRGTTNQNRRGSSTDRRRRREWLVTTYRSDVDTTSGVSTCRCYRCGVLLTVDTVTVDRIIPGCLGGTYMRDNIRPACGPCSNSIVGGSLRGTE